PDSLEEVVEALEVAVVMEAAVASEEATEVDLEVVTEEDLEVVTEVEVDMEVAAVLELSKSSRSQEVVEDMEAEVDTEAEADTEVVAVADMEAVDGNGVKRFLYYIPFSLNFNLLFSIKILNLWFSVQFKNNTIHHVNKFNKLFYS
ncbi:uncharacterized protein LOC108743887, partial [Agrilus planipennis]|uniref:Uncharacterized protein LOC108743887 n=1 Tax=Agrilus planipennis TaxID=224129 RepID=A0A1W4XGH7_AGRPL